MHVYFCGIGGTGLGPLALIAKQAGYQVSGSDKQDSEYIKYLKNKGISDIHIGQSEEQIAKVHDKNPIDWFVYSSAVVMEQANPPELSFCHQQKIKTSKRDELINQILTDKNLKLMAVAGTHGKTTTTAIAVWLFKKLGIPIGYSVGAKISFGEMGEYQDGAEYFVYECDEFDRNFLSFEPAISLITGVSWDHHEIYPTREDYQEAFREFISQSQNTITWGEDADYLGLNASDKVQIIDSGNEQINKITLPGRYNRLDAWLVIQAAQKIVDEPIEKMIEIVNKFPGLQRRMEEIAPGLYSDYAHTPEKIRGAMSVASEMAQQDSKKIVVIFEPLHNRRQHFMIDEYQDCFDGASKLYWVPSYLAREDESQRIISPAEMIEHLSNPSIAKPAEINQELKTKIQEHLKNGDMVIGMTGGGGGSLDEWLRQEFKD